MVGGGHSQRAAGPQHAAGKGLEHQEPPRLCHRSWQETLDLQHPRCGTIPLTLQHAIFLAPRTPTPQPHLDPAMLSEDFWEPMEVVEGLVGGPARRESGTWGTMTHPEVHVPLPRTCEGGSAHVPWAVRAGVGTADAPAPGCGGHPCPSSPWPPPPWTHHWSSSAFPSRR